MALALLLATAGREELSAPVPCLVQPGEGSGGTMSIRSRAGQGETRFTMLCLGLSKTPFYLSFSFLPPFFSLKVKIRLFCVLLFLHARVACFLSPLIKCIPHSYDLTDMEQS